MSWAEIDFTKVELLSEILQSFPYQVRILHVWGDLMKNTVSTNVFQQFRVS